MAVGTINSGTGAATLPDTGRLSYNGVTFSCLYKSKVTGPAIQDEARRTTKYVEYTLEVDGLVTLEQGNSNTDSTWQFLRARLSQHGGYLNYSGNGFGGLVVNQPNGNTWDLAWGPIPKILAFQPLGQGRSAFIRWQVVCHIPELRPQTVTLSASGTLQGGLPPLRSTYQGRNGPVLQFNWETDLTYDDEGYSGLSIHGTLEIPLTRSAQAARAIQETVDDFRQRFLNIQYDATKFRVVNRHFSYSRDKRTVEWEFVSEELAPGGLPPFCTAARGVMSVRPAKAGSKLIPIMLPIWSCNLKATYTVEPRQPRRAAIWAFYSLLKVRMDSAVNGIFPKGLDVASGSQQPKPNPKLWPKLVNDLGPTALGLATLSPIGAGIGAAFSAVATFGTLFPGQKNAQPNNKLKSCVAIPTHFGYDEGLYLDSKQFTIEASWIVATTLSTVFPATGTFRYNPNVGGVTWIQSMKDITGWKSWLPNIVDPSADVIVDLGGGAPGPVLNPIR